MAYDRTELIADYRRKARLRFLFFWGHQASRDGSITASCFSQWWPSPFEDGGHRYPTAEHWMMAEKARLFGDDETAKRILGAGSPKEAKQLGREVLGFDEAIWDQAKRSIVTRGSLYKFEQNAPIRAFLLSTADRVLVEASPVDRVWGIGLAADDDKAANPLLWRGENLLGFVLMDVRDRLRS